MKLEKIIVGIIDYGVSFNSFLARPREFASQLLRPSSSPIKAAGITAWSIATIAFCIGAYNLLFGSMFQNLGMNIALPSKYDDAAIVSINSFLAFVDRNNAEDPLPAISSIAESQITKGLMHELLDDMEASRGKLKRRVFREVSYLPDGWVDWPKGEYVIAKYESQYQRGSVLEEVISHFDEGGWKIAGYLITPIDNLPADKQPPEILDWWWGFGFGVAFPDSLDVSKPQSAVIHTGFLGVLIYPVVPAKLSGGTTATLLFALLALVTIFCIHPVAKLMKAQAHFIDAFRLGLAGFSFSALFLVLCFTFSMLVLVDILRLKGLGLLASIAVCGILPPLIVAIRGFFGIFGRLYAFSTWRMLVVCFFTTVCAILITPLTFLPGFLAILKLEPWIGLFW